MDRSSVLPVNEADEKKSSGKFFDPSLFILMGGVGLNFFRFLKSLGMSGERNLVILSARDNYSCGEVDLRNARVLINLKKLNLIKHLDLFLNTLVRILPPETSFIGCFSDGNKGNHGFFYPASIIKLMNRFSGFYHSRKKHIMNRDEVMELLEKNGFRTLEMKEISGLTYFISQNIRLPA